MQNRKKGRDLRKVHPEAGGVGSQKGGKGQGDASDLGSSRAKSLVRLGSMQNPERLEIQRVGGLSITSLHNSCRGAPHD